MRKIKLITSFKYNPCILLRIIRFSIEYKIMINKKVVDYIKNNKHLFNNSHIEIKEEFENIVLSDNAKEIIDELYKLGILKYILPELCECYGFNQHTKYHNLNVYEHIIKVVENVNKTHLLKMAALLHDIGKPKCFTIDNKGRGHFYNHEKISAEMSKDILKRFEYSDDFIKSVNILIVNHMKKCKIANLKGVEGLIKSSKRENPLDVLNLQIADNLAKNPEYIEIKSLIELYIMYVLMKNK